MMILQLPGNQQVSKVSRIKCLLLILRMDIFSKSSKSYLIVKKKKKKKKKCLKDAKTRFTDTNINITTNRRKHFGTVVGSDTKGPVC